jgi:ketosteroid isomerase-like protein
VIGGGGKGMSDEAAIRARLDALARLIAARDMGIVDALANPRGFLMLGSEAGERASGREEITALFRALFAQPYALSFIWDAPEVTIAGDIAWVTAEGIMNVVRPTGTRPMPYRMVGIFERGPEGWAWRLFSGSEPAPPPPEE